MSLRAFMVSEKTAVGYILMSSKRAIYSPTATAVHNQLVYCQRLPTRQNRHTVGDWSLMGLVRRNLESFTVLADTTKTSLLVLNLIRLVALTRIYQMMSQTNTHRARIIPFYLHLK